MPGNDRPTKFTYNVEQQIYVVARDRKNNMICLGGLGPLGNEQRWMEEKDTHRKYPGYHNFEKRVCPKELLNGNE